MFCFLCIVNANISFAQHELVPLCDMYHGLVFINVFFPSFVCSTWFSTIIWYVPCFGLYIICFSTNMFARRDLVPVFGMYHYLVCAKCWFLFICLVFQNNLCSTLFSTIIWYVPFTWYVPSSGFYIVLLPKALLVTVS